jgi:hypothetical protein
MFKVLDKTGQQIFLRDKVVYEAQLDDMGLLGEEEGLSIGFPSEDTVQVQPLGKGGTPKVMDACDVTVTYSLVQKIAQLGSHEELQELIAAAEIRYNSAVEDDKASRRKPRTAGKKAAKKKTPTPQSSKPTPQAKRPTPPPKAGPTPTKVKKEVPSWKKASQTEML